MGNDGFTKSRGVDMQTIRRIAWQAINVYADYCDKGYTKEDAREKAEQEVMECHAEASLTKMETTQ